jgi:Domain of unknown function (DUF1902)
MIYNVTAQYDAENHIYRTLESDIPGLNVETPSLDGFIEVVLDVAPDLLPGGATVIDIEFHVAGLSRVPAKPANGNLPRLI